MRKIVVSLLMATLALAAVTPVAAAIPPGDCQGEVVSFAVRFFDGRRDVAATFFGDYPQAVQDAEWFLRSYCGF